MSETIPNVGRNEPCPCGSGKKYKRCHGVSAAPKLSTPSVPTEGMGEASGAANPLANMDPAVMMQVSQALQRLPRGQIQKLQGIMQRAMAGRDVSREAAEFERTLPPEFKTLLQGFQGMEGAQVPEVAPQAPAGGMSEDEARAIVAAAAAEGKISGDQAASLLEGASEGESSGGGLGRLWRGLKGKK